MHVHTRAYIACNSFFVALIRYFYIVYQEKSNQYEFEKIGRLFCILSFVVPILIESLGILTSDYAEYQLAVPEGEWKSCIADHIKKNSSMIQIPYPTYPLKWTMTIFPESIIQILWFTWLSITFLANSHVAEIFFYWNIFQTIRR